MSKIAYTVITTIKYKSVVDDWLEWIQGGHIDDVIKGGASSGQVVKMDSVESDHSGTETYEIRYIFDNRGIFEEYLEKHAPALRAEGLEKFPREDGFTYKRTVGEIL